MSQDHLLGGIVDPAYQQRPSSGYYPKDKRAWTWLDTGHVIPIQSMISRYQFVPPYKDIPDGHGYCGLKALSLVKLGLYTGVPIAVVDNVMRNFVAPVQVKSHLYHVAKVNGPIAIAAGTYGFTSSLVNIIRGKDDYYNHAIGGGITGIIMGCYWQRFTFSFHMGIGFAVCGAIYKYCHDRNIKLLFTYDYNRSYEENSSLGYGDFRSLKKDHLSEIYDKPIKYLKELPM